MICDIIGDVHGQATLLIRLLRKLGYRRDEEGAWWHEAGKAFFLGDLINKGPEIKETVSIVRKMEQKGNCACIIGNHEWAFINGSGPAVQDTLDAYGNDQELLERDIGWIATLPLWIEMEKFRLVHAFWDPAAIAVLKEFRKLNPDWREVTAGSRVEMAAIRLLKGPYYHPAPDEGVLHHGREIQLMRLRWWNLDVPLYDPSEKPLFFGHYCISARPAIISEQICCLDTCVHRTGRLTAYRWEGETVLQNSRLVTVKA